MKLTYRTVECRTKRTFKISQSASDRFRMVICELRHGEHVGYGEASPSKRVTGETIESVGRFLDWAAKEVDALAPDDWQRFLDHVHNDICAPDGPAGPSAPSPTLRGNPSARAALDLAMHDLVGKAQGVPVRALYELPRARLETCMTVSLDEPKVMADEARGYREEGFRVLKLKLGKGDADVDRVQSVRAAVPDARLRADANTGWSVDEAQRLTRALAPHVEFIEQPFLPSMDADLASLSRESPLTIYADESVMDVRDVRRLHALGFRGGVRRNSEGQEVPVHVGVNVKLQKTGGIRTAIAAIREARDKGYHVQLGCNIETAVGIAAGVQLLGALDHADLDGHLLLGDAPFLGPMPREGWYETPDAPGLGARPA